jgi:RNA polymerase sigma-70 factor, ECF subfamily
MNGLSAKQRAVIFLRYYAGLSYAEIAEALDLPVGTVQSRLNAALMALRTNLVQSDGSAKTNNPARTKGVTQ